MQSRREFLITLGAASAAAALPAPLGAQERLYPPADLSYFDTPIQPKGADLRFGYAAITWGGRDEEAMADIAAAGYRGIQLRANAVEAWTDRRAALKERLASHRLTFVALSSGRVDLDPATREEQIALHARHAAFVRECGGLYLQVTDRRPDRVAPGDYAALGRLLTEIGRRTADAGVPLSYHNHMGNLGERPDEIDRILDAADPRFVHVEIDTAHYRMGGGDPAAAIRKYKGRHLYFHLKDLQTPVPAQAGHDGQPYRFVELGRGQVDFPACFKALGDIAFRGWCIVELDRVPDEARTPKAAAELSKQYIERAIGMKV